MKKLVLCIALILVFATAICAVSVNLNPTDKKDPNDVTGLNNAKEYLSTMLNNASLSTGADFTRPAVLKNKEGSYTVEWKLTVTSGPAEGISLGAIENGLLSINVDEFSPEEIVYTLTATITDENGNTETLTFNHKVPAFKINTYEEYIAGCIAGSKEEVFTVKGYVVGISAKPGGSSVGSIWLVDEDGNGYYAYKPTLSNEVLETRESMNAAFPRGTEIVVKGTVTKYGGCYEFTKDCEIIYTGKSVDPATLPYVDRTELFGSAKNMQDAETLDAVQSTRATLNGVILGEIPEEGDYNYHFTVNGVDFIFYSNLYLLDEEENKAVVDAWEPGAKANLTGVINVYSGNFQLYPDSVDSIEIVNEVLTDAEKVERQKGLLSLEKSYDKDFVLPEGKIADIAWSIEGAGATLGENNAVTLNQTNEDQIVTITATISSGSASDTAVFTVTIKSSVIDWKDIAFAVTECAKLDGASKQTSEEEYYFFGIVNDIYNTTYCNFHLIDDAENDIIVYGLSDAENNKFGSKFNKEIPFQAGDLLCVRGKLQNYNGTYEIVNAVLVETPAKGTTYFVPFTATEAAAECAKLDGPSKETGKDFFFIKGTVNDIYNTTYCNFHLIDDAEGDMIVYGLSDAEKNKFGSKFNKEIPFQVGDVMLVKGNFQNYNGTYEIVNAVLISYYTPEVEEPETPENPENPENPETPEEPETPSAITTIAGALAGAEGATASFSGTVSEIYQAWSEEHGNISFYVTDGTNTILVFRTSTKAYIGDVVSVNGTITVYQEVNQIAQGSTVVVTTPHTCDMSEASCTEASTCSICGKVEGEALGHTAPNAEGKCDTCGTLLESAAELITVTADYTGATTGNMTGGNDAATLGLDANIFTASSEKTNSGQNHVGLNKAGNIRLYKNSTATLTISVASGYEIVSIKVTLASSSKATGVLRVTDGTTEITANGTTYVVNGNTVVLDNTGSDQVHIDSIEIVYVATNA